MVRNEVEAEVKARSRDAAGFNADFGDSILEELVHS
jgi:hypothetical protein